MFQNHRAFSFIQTSSSFSRPLKTRGFKCSSWACIISQSCFTVSKICYIYRIKTWNGWAFISWVLAWIIINGFHFSRCDQWLHAGLPGWFPCVVWEPLPLWDPNDAFKLWKNNKNMNKNKITALNLKIKDHLRLFV